MAGDEVGILYCEQLKFFIVKILKMRVRLFMKFRRQKGLRWRKCLS